MLNIFQLDFKKLFLMLIHLYHFQFYQQFMKKHTPIIKRF